MAWIYITSTEMNTLSARDKLDKKLIATVAFNVNYNCAAFKATATLVHRPPGPHLQTSWCGGPVQQGALVLVFTHSLRGLNLAYAEQLPKVQQHWNDNSL